MKPKLVIFDFDGVIANTEDEFFNSLHQTLCNCGITISFKACCKTFAGSDTLTTLEKVAKEHNSSLKAADIHKLLLQNKEAWMQKVTAMPYIKDILSTLKVPYCIASNSNLEHIDHTLELIKLSHFFNDKNKFSAPLLGKFKPNPAVYLEALKKMGFKANEALAIEDSVPGVQAANAAAIPVIGYASSSHVNPEEHKATLKQNGAFTAISSFKEAIPIIV